MVFSTVTGSTILSPFCRALARYRGPGSFSSGEGLYFALTVATATIRAPVRRPDEPARRQHPRSSCNIQTRVALRSQEKKDIFASPGGFAAAGPARLVAGFPGLRPAARYTMTIGVTRCYQHDRCADSRQEHSFNQDTVPRRRNRRRFQ